jgi:solute carrier family 25 protein 33/36
MFLYIATLIGIIPARSAYFFAYQQSKRTIAKWATTTGNEKIIVPQTVTSLFAEGSVMNSILSGLFAGIASNTITSPIWMVKTRMQILADSSAGQRVYKSYKEVISTIAKEEGIQGFYKGIFASYWGCAEGCIQFVLYEQFKTYLHKRRQEQQTIMGNQNPKNALHRDLPPHVYFIAAAVAKGIASIATYPHEVARTRLREQARDGLFLYSGMWQTLSIIAKQEGWRGLYAGMGIHLLKVVPNSAIMFLTYEICNSYLDRQFTICSKYCMLK